MKDSVRTDSSINAKVIWVERLNLRGILFFLIVNLRSGLIVKFDEHQTSSIIKRIIELLRNTGLGDIFSPARLLLNLKDKNGYALEYYRANDLTEILDSFCNACISHKPQWYRNMIRCYLSQYLDRHITFIIMVKAQASRMGAGEYEIWIRGGFAAYLAVNFYKSKGIKIVRSTAISSYFRLILNPIYNLARILFFQMFPPGRSRDGDLYNSIPSAWIECTPGGGIWSNFMASLGEKMTNKTCKFVYYFDRSDTLFKPETIKFIEQMGFECIDLYRFKHSFLKPDDLIYIFQGLKKNNASSPSWLIFVEFSFRVFFKAYLNLFKKFNVKVLIQHQETSWIQEAQAQAIKVSGGVMIGLHWSDYIHYTYPSHLTPQHVFFTWGRAHFESLQRKGHTCDYILPSGLWMEANSNHDHLFINFRKSQRCVICIFDGTAAYDIEQAPESVSQFYINMIEVLENFSHYGAIIKSKQWELADLAFFPRGDEIVRRLNSLITEKRAIFLDPAVFSPVDAALHSNLSVSCGVNSAGMIAGLYGCRTIHWDCAGFLNFPIYRVKDQKVIFSSMEDVKQAVEEYAAGNKKIGDFSIWKKQINYFDDASGLDRILKFIDSFVSEQDKTGDRELSLKYAVNRYIEENKISNDFFQTKTKEWWN